MLVACVMLNVTRASQVKHVIWEFFRRWPTPSAVADADSDEIRELIRPLGFYNRRTDRLQELSRHVRDHGVTIDGGMPGVGQYATDSYRIFVEGELIDPGDVTDVVLEAYLTWAWNTTSS